VNYPKRLIEVDLPIKRISAHARREKSIRHGHISTLHIWWARRPLAACRAVICAALWPDPADEHCPAAFRKAAEKILLDFARKITSDTQLANDHCSPENFKLWQRLAGGAGFQPAAQPQKTSETGWKPAPPLALRSALLDFIADFANWDNSTVREYLDTARLLTAVAHNSLSDPKFKLPPEGPDFLSTLSHQLSTAPKPLVVDPFCGGGSIPLEALRVGADAFASDLNPIPVLLNKVVLEYIPKYGQRLADEVRKWGEWINKAAQQELAEFQPKDADGATPIAFLWARTIQCEGPGCGAEVPLIKSLWLGKKPHNSWSLKLVPHPRKHHVAFEVVQGAKPDQVGQGTVKRGSATCPCCGYTTPSKNVRKQLFHRHGGASDARLFCVVTTRPGDKGRFYRTATEKDTEAANKAKLQLEALKRSRKDTHLTPNEPTPVGGGKGAGRAFSQRNFGMDAFEDLFTPRQQLTLVTLVHHLKLATKEIAKQHSDGLAEAVQVALALNIDKMADYGSSLASWSSPASQETVRGTFSRQALSVVWDFAEAYPFATSSGGWLHNLNYLISPLESEARAALPQGHVERASATNHPMPDDSVDAFVTDPPYYDAIPYADLSDFFIVWLKRSLEGSHMAKNFASLSPKDEECVVDEIKGHDGAFFEKTMGKALTEGRRLTKPDGVGIVVFAHKSTAGWEAQLQAMIDAGWVITGSWPIDTEREGRTRANSSAALASSVHLVCRPRENPDGSVRTDEVGDWRDVLAELPRRIHDWMPRLAEEGVVGADAIFACLGPALEIFSRYSRVEKASGEAITLGEYLVQVWAAVAKEALTMIFTGADTSAFEEDARLTAMWLWTLKTDDQRSENRDQSAEDDSGDDEEGGGKKGGGGGFALEFDAARKIAQGLGAHLEDLASLVAVEGETARLLPVAERANHLFGKDEGKGAPIRRKRGPQMELFKAAQDATQAEATFGETKVEKVGATVLDRVHQSMILFAAGRSEALKRFLVEDGAGNNTRFWTLAQALSALYPASTDEKHWVDGVLARKKGLGF
jgi:adenine-specific DNA methylase